MSKDFQSASVRAEANCGAEAKTPAASLTREQARDAAHLELEHARACLQLWIGGDGEKFDDFESAVVARDTFCYALGAMLERAELAISAMQEDLGDGELRALLLIEGTHELLTGAAAAGALTPRSGCAVQALVVQAAEALLADAPAEVLQ